MKTVSVNVYEFSELSDVAKERAREWYRRACDGDSDWADFVIEDATTCLKHMGYDSVRIAYTGFWSQGDGAQFTGTWDARRVNVAGLGIDDTELLRIARGLAPIAATFPDASATIAHRGHYSHSGCTQFEYDNVGTVAAEDEFRKLSRAAMDWIYVQLENAYNYTQSDENIELNEYGFTLDGNRSTVL